MENKELTVNCQCENCQLRALFFAHLKEDEMLDICNLRKEKSFESNDDIVQQGDEVMDFFYLKEGLVKLHIIKSGNEDQIITIAKPLDFISILSIFSSDKYQYTISALVPSVVCQVDMSLIKSFATKNAAFGFDLMKQLSKSTDLILLEAMELKRLQLNGKLAYPEKFTANS